MMLDASDKVLGDMLNDAITTVLPAEARYALVWVLTDADGRVDLETAVLNSVANVDTDVLRRFGQMMIARPTETMVMGGPSGSS